MKKKMTTEAFLKRIKDAHPELFDINEYTDTVYVSGNVKISVKCKKHGTFQVWPRDHLNGMSGCKECISLKRKQTNLKKYGVENYFQRTDLIQHALIKKYGVINPGMLPNHIEKIKSTNIKKYGVEWATQSPNVQEKTRKTNLIKYGVEYLMQDKTFSKRTVESKIQNGKFSKSNSSNEATCFIKSYIKNNNYEISQCAYADNDLNLHEWGIYHNGRWVLYDLVVFEKGHRGDKNHIIEILEYHGPFHYTLNEVQQFRNQKAYPWNSNNTTVEESYMRDLEKELLGKKLTQKYTIIRTRNEFNLWHKKDKD